METGFQQVSGPGAKVKKSSNRTSWDRFCQFLEPKPKSFKIVLPIEKLGELLEAPSSFCLTISYNPGYQSVLKDLKQSTRQRFVALEFDYPKPEIEQVIVETESKIDAAMAEKLVKFGNMTRNLKGNGLQEGASTRLLVNAAKLMGQDIAPVEATDTAIAQALTDESDMLQAVHELSRSIF